MRSNGDQVLAEAEELFDKASQYLPAKGVTLVKEAYQFAAERHAGQMRLSGDPVITHPLHTALTIVELQLDADAVAAAVLHDVQEDCGVENGAIQKQFGSEVAKLVDGVTKLGQIPWQAPEQGDREQEVQAENLRKMFLAMAEDLRVVIIKLADRLHNMQTLHPLPEADQQRISKETIEIYAPLAGRLGIWQLKWQLEDLAFRYLEPQAYRRIAEMLDARREARERYIAYVEGVIREELTKQGIKAEVRGRAKHLYSIHQKMERYTAEGKSFHEIYDLLAVRILVDTVADCYNAMGAIHQLWRPLPGTFDDYIANPKESMYQSLHTTVMCLGQRPLEVQVRTHQMHQTDEYGVASHWRYKEGGKRDVRYEERLAWLRQLIDWQRDLSRAEDLVEAVKTDLFRDQVFVFTPKGEVKDLPVGATPIDFAYRIHTDLGHTCVGAKVNGRLVPLNYQLRNGDAVEIMTSKSSRGPSRDWLGPSMGYVRTSNAREKIRQWFKKQERAENINRGRDLVEKELKRLGVALAQVEDEILRVFKYEELESFLEAVGYGGISTHHMILRLAPVLQPLEEAPAPTTEAGPPAAVVTPDIRVFGTGHLLSRTARCCNPVPGDDIIGYVTRGEGVTVHRRDCHNILHVSEKERLVEVEWGRRGQFYPVAVHIEAWDRVGLLRDVSALVAEEKVNMAGLRTQEQGDGTLSVFVTLEITGIEQLVRLLSRVSSVRGVISVKRWLEAGGSE
ncbi:MAG: bifunctional (p)ppGpp synthetase/guanosine-3',5'-bis(diphosphate) 3'-pyrophosphohydrolase [Dehalococcoidia bacterium]|nr:MAG: bifunctional (p)ppGpp synthetase/guanosine-3',5'-bis(diphosphate) 3'-pyrophosphohydrolase [Dehalococcoidia bacterium]